MALTEPHDLVNAAQSGDAAALALLAEALYRSDLQPDARPAAAEVRAAVASHLTGSGDPSPPVTGADDTRMRWCRNLVALTYCDRPSDDAAHLRDLFWRRA